MIRTVGELRALIAGLSDDTPIWVLAFGSRNSIANVLHQSTECIIVPAGLVDIIKETESEAT